MRTFSLSFCAAKLQIIPENQAILHDYLVHLTPAIILCVTPLPYFYLTREPF